MLGCLGAARQLAVLAVLLAAVLSSDVPNIKYRGDLSAYIALAGCPTAARKRGKCLHIHGSWHRAMLVHFPASASLRAIRSRILSRMSHLPNFCFQFDSKPLALAQETKQAMNVMKFVNSNKGGQNVIFVDTKKCSDSTRDASTAFPTPVPVAPTSNPIASPSVAPTATPTLWFQLYREPTTGKDFVYNRDTQAKHVQQAKRHAQLPSFFKVADTAYKHKNNPPSFFKVIQDSP